MGGMLAAYGSGTSPSDCTSSVRVLRGRLVGCRPSSLVAEPLPLPAAAAGGMGAAWRRGRGLAVPVLERGRAAVLLALSDTLKVILSDVTSS